jgi:glutamine amidotransferase
MIGIINYGLGNIRAIQNVFIKLDHPVRIITKVDEFDSINKLILPGVGAFDYAMNMFNNSGLKEKVIEHAIEKEQPLLGICVGAQMLCASSEEGEVPGLNWINAKVKKFQLLGGKKTSQLPHMGWNDVTPQQYSPLFVGLETAARFYFLHSYYIECFEPKQVIATSHYQSEFVCAVNHNNIFGVQFHPEKSHGYGVQLLDNFAKIK